MGSREVIKTNTNSLIQASNIPPHQENLIGTNHPLLTIMQVFSLAELAISKKDVVYWTISENLDKHRETREYDVHVQKMLLFLERVGSFQAEEVSCGGNGFYRTLLKNPQTDECILVVHSWDRDALYLKKYLQMNSDIHNPKFALIQYDLNQSRTHLENLKFVIPVEGGLAYVPNDLMPLVSEVRKTLSVSTHNISEYVQSMKNKLTEIEGNAFKEIDKKGDT